MERSPGSALAPRQNQFQVPQTPSAVFSPPGHYSNQISPPGCTRSYTRQRSSAISPAREKPSTRGL